MAGMHKGLLLAPTCACVLALGVARADVGALTPLGCIQNTGGTACATVPGLEGANAVAVSPDGANVYVASQASYAIVTFARGPGGALTPGGCIQNTGGTECASTAPGIVDAEGVAVSPDGANVYVAGVGSSAIAVFTRGAGGMLTPGGCIQNTGGTDCVGVGGTAPGLEGLWSVAVSPDGANVYAAAYDSDAVAVFARGTGGALTAAGCIQNTGRTDCTGFGGTTPGLDGSEDVAVTPDGANVYVVSYSSSAIVTFARGPGGALIPRGCIQNTGGTDCATTTPGLDGPEAVAVSPDGANVYVASYSSGAITVFARGPAGELTPRGCIQYVGGTDCAANDPGIGSPGDVAVSPDGRNVYVASLGGRIAVFTRGPDGALAPGACIQKTGGTACAVTAPGIDGSEGVTVSPDGANVYVAAFYSHAIAAFARELPPPTTTTTTTTTLPGCPPDGFPGLRCALAPGLGQTACVSDSPPRKIVRRFGRALRALDQAEAAARPARARRLLGRVESSLGRTARAVDGAAARGRLSQGCVAALDVMLADGRERAARLALAATGG